MAYIVVEASVRTHWKFLAAGPAASWLWLCGLGYCQDGLTDGFIPKSAIEFLGVKRAAKLAPKLVAARLWDIVPPDTGWQMHDYLDHNKSAEAVRGLMRQRADWGKLGGRPKRTSKVSEQKGEGYGEPFEGLQNTEKVSETLSDPVLPGLPDLPSGTGRDVHAPAGETAVACSHSEPPQSARSSPNAALVRRDAAGRALADGVAWGSSNRHISTALTSTGFDHRKCFFAPEACARGLCIPGFLGGQWTGQAGDAAVATFIRFTLASTPEGPVGDPLVFWRDKWQIAHGQASTRRTGARTDDTIAAARASLEDRLGRLGDD